MIPPATVSTLRTTEIIVACIVNIILTHRMPEPFDIIGSSLVFLAALCLIFEEKLSNFILKTVKSNCEQMRKISLKRVHPLKEDLK